MSDTSPRDTNPVIKEARLRAERQKAAERRTLAQQGLERGVQQEVAEERVESEDLAEDLADSVKRDNPWRVRRETLPVMLLLIMLFLILYLLAAATGRSNIIQFPGSNNAPSQLEPVIPSGGAGQGSGGNTFSVNKTSNGNAGLVAPLNSVQIQTYAVDPLFVDYYNRSGGLTTCGLAISQKMLMNGRPVQWFERCRLEEWNEPGYAGTPYQIQGGRVGAEFTQNIDFPRQTFFVSRPGNRYFAETGYGVSERFLQFWEQNGGLDVLGYPISNEVQERIDGVVIRVQYFERARLEFHPEAAGTPYEVQMGRLGMALLLSKGQPNIIAPPEPTAVPMPQG